MKNFKYVNFSRSTARKNPKMVIREYEKLIAESEYELSKKTTYVGVKVKLCSKLISFVETNKRYTHPNDEYYEQFIFYEHKITFEDFLELYHDSIKNHRDIMHNIEHIKSVKEEFYKFKDKYYFGKR